jgi:hypothetical protein
MSEIKEALESIRTVNGYLFDVRVLSETDKDCNLSVRVLNSKVLRLNPMGEGKTASLLLEYCEQVLADAGIDYELEKENNQLKGEQEDATTETFDSDGCEDRNDDRDCGESCCE